MSNKAVLVIDKPNNCAECELTSMKGYSKYNSYCPILNEFIDNPNDGIHSECPLKPLPFKRPCNYYDFEHYQAGFDKGWNACIDDITYKKEKKNDADDDG